MKDVLDADISSQDGKGTTHSLAMLITEPKPAFSDDQSTNRESITRVEKPDMGEGVEYDIPVRHYQEPKTVPIPEKLSKKNFLPSKILCSAIIAEKRAKELDTAFLLDITQDEWSCPEYNGYNTHQGHCGKTPCHRSWLACSTCIVGL